MADGKERTSVGAGIARRSILGGAAGLLAGGASTAGFFAAREGGVVASGPSRARAIGGGDVQPPSADVVVIGGGNIGCVTALELVERGLKVVLCEKGVIAGEASGRSMGYVDTLFAAPDKLPLLNRSKQLWEGISARLGADVGYRRSGVMLNITSEELLAAATGWVQSLQGGEGAAARILTAEEAQQRAPANRERLIGALFDESNGFVEPQWFAPAVASKARSLGASIVENCAVRRIDVQGGRVTGVFTEKGRIACSYVVMAGGIWSPALAAGLGLDLCQFMGFSTAVRLAPGHNPATVPTVASNLLVSRPNAWGGTDMAVAVAASPFVASMVPNAARLLPAWDGLKDQLRPVLSVKTLAWDWSARRAFDADEVTPFERMRICAGEPTQFQTDLLKEGLKRSYPALVAAPVVERWSGALMNTLDNNPIVSDVPSIGGLVIGSGFYFGLTMAPAAGEALADLVTGRTPKFDLRPFRYSRFHDGSPVVFSN